MQSKRTVILWLLMVFLLINSLLLAQEGRKPDDRKNATSPPSRFEKKERLIPTEERLLSGIDRVLKRGDTYIAKEEMYWALETIQEYAEVVNSQKMADKIIAIPEYELWNRDHPENAYSVLGMKLSVLSFFEEYTGVREYVIKHLDHKLPGIQASAARTLLHWGDWELAAPVICRNEAYIIFQGYKDERAIPLLYDAVENGSWQGRMFAAAALFYTYGDSTKYSQAALDVILNAPINTDDENTNRAKYMALAQVARFGLTGALPGLIRLSQDTASGISSNAVGYLIDLSGMGYQEATQAIIDIKDNHPNANIREIAKHGLLKLEQQQK